jgi:ATP/maltotriose-dependent transcriptional regulator MalT
MSTDADLIAQARAAARVGSWGPALDLFEAADQAEMGPPDLEAMADCAWWLCKLDQAMSTRQRAYRAFAAAGDHPRAAYNAWFLAYDCFSMGEATVGGGWLARAQRHIADQPQCVEHAYLAIADAHQAEADGRWEDACGASLRAIDLGERFGDRDVTAVALQTLGHELIALGEVPEGLRLLDEAMTSVIAHELGDFCTGWVYCGVLISCLELGEVGRAADWSDAATRWCDSFPEATPYNGLCRVYRVGVLSLRGAFSEAESAAHRASAELSAFVPGLASGAWYEIGEIRRRLGDLEGAENAFKRALELGGDAQPGLALVRLAQGRLDAAEAGLRTSLANAEANRLARTRLLAARVQVGLARRDQAAAHEASAELRRLSDNYGSSFVRAHADMAEGEVRLSEADVIGALDDLQRAWRGWQALKLPYEAAMTRALIGEAARAVGDDERAELERQAATDAFEQLGISHEAHQGTLAMLARGRLPGGLTPREAQVLSAVAMGRTNRQIAAELVISEHTVARHLSNIFAKLGVTSRAAAAAFAMEKGLVVPRPGPQN